MSLLAILQKHREERLAALRDRYANDEQIRLTKAETARLWKERNPDKARAIVRDWAIANPEKRRASEIRWREANRAATRARAARRRAVERSVEAERFLDTEVFDRDGWRCQLCGRKVNPTYRNPHPWSPSLDHVIPISEGGPHTRANTQLTHFRCNIQKHNRLTADGEQLRVVG